MGVFWLSLSHPTASQLALGLLSIFQVILTVSLGRVTEAEVPLLQVRASGDDIVRIRISIVQLFKNFRFSIFLLCIYWFYCWTMMRYEVSHLIDPFRYCEYFTPLPLIYIAIDLCAIRLMDRVKNWYLLCLILLGVQINLTIIETILRAKFPDLERSAFFAFAINAILMQKMVMISINATMLDIFDVENLRVRNYLSCEVTSHPEQGPLRDQRPVDDLRGHFLQLGVRNDHEGVPGSVAH